MNRPWIYQRPQRRSRNTNRYEANPFVSMRTLLARKSGRSAQRTRPSICANTAWSSSARPQPLRAGRRSPTQPPSWSATECRGARRRGEGPRLSATASWSMIIPVASGRWSNDAWSRGWNSRPQIAELDGLDRASLSDHWREAFGRPPPKYLSSAVYEAGSDLGLPKQGVGCLPRRTRRSWPASGSVSRRAWRTLNCQRAGSHLVREWNGKDLPGEVTSSGYVMDGKTWRTHFASQTHTGAHWSGPASSGPLTRGVRCANLHPQEHRGGVGSGFQHLGSAGGL